MRATRSHRRRLPTNPRYRRSITAAVVCLVLAAGSPIGSQQPTPAPTRADGAPSFQEVVEVNIVNLTVRVTDRDGIPVQQLERKDFEVLENGAPVPITNFYEVKSTTDYDQVRRERERGARQAVAPPPAPSDQQPAAESSQPLRHLAIFVDN